MSEVAAVLRGQRDNGYWLTGAILCAEHFPLASRKLPPARAGACTTRHIDKRAPSDQNSRILQIYNLYRLALSSILLATFLTNPVTTQLGSLDPTLFLQTALVHTTFSLLVLLALRWREPTQLPAQIPSALFMVDILALTLLGYASSGVESGLALLHLVTIAAASLLLRRRMSTFLAAIATLAVIFSELYIGLRAFVPANQYIQAGLLGALMLAASFYLESLAERMRLGAQLAAEQASSILNLEQLNQLIIRRMRTGVLVVDDEGKVLTANDAALQLLHDDERLRSMPVLTELPTALRQQLRQWQENTGARQPAFALNRTSAQLQASFAYLNPGSKAGILIFLEDNTQMIQRVRQMKLASLGRLTASIAHEIRNPLGAISHASQLLRESADLPAADARLVEIILTHCARVNHIIEDVLQMSRQRQEASERITLQDWLETYIDNYRATHFLNGTITLNIDPPDTQVRVITSQLEQILNNLFENGLRYSQRSTGIGHLTLIGGMNGMNAPFLHVIDEGPGVDAATEEHLFEPFHTTENSGTGLGLYISKELCEANQARLSYRRTEDGRSCFSIHFPHPDRNMA